MIDLSDVKRQDWEVELRFGGGGKQKKCNPMTSQKSNDIIHLLTDTSSLSILYWPLHWLKNVNGLHGRIWLVT